MCGIVGCAGVIGANEEKLFKQLLIIDSLRGEDSTGIAAVNMSNDVMVAKSIGDPFMLFDTSRGVELFRRSNRVLIGHNRFATTGKVNRKNAHPFEFDHVVGVHNGTLTNKYDLEDQRNFDVDSEALYNLINKYGPKEAISKARGAWALSWWDSSNKTINFLRNKERPLFFTILETGKTIFWASEQWMLTAILGRAEVKHSEVFYFNEDSHFYWEVDLLNPSFGKPKCVSDCKGLDPLPPTVRVVGTVTHLPVTGTTKGGTNNPKGKSVNSSKSISLRSFDQSYLGKQIKVYFGDTVVKDSHGCDYLPIYDQDNLEADLRMYFHARNIDQFIGKYAKVVVSSSKRDFRKNVIFYKVKIDQVELSTVADELAESLQQELLLENLVKVDKDGNVISAEDLERYYHTCLWCSDSIDHTHDNVYLRRDVGVLCDFCKDNPEISKYL